MNSSVTHALAGGVSETGSEYRCEQCNEVTVGVREQLACSPPPVLVLSMEDAMALLEADLLDVNPSNSALLPPKLPFDVSLPCVTNDDKRYAARYKLFSFYSRVKTDRGQSLWGFYQSSRHGGWRVFTGWQRPQSVSVTQLVEYLGTPVLFFCFLDSKQTPPAGEILESIRPSSSSSSSVSDSSSSPPQSSSSATAADIAGDVIHPVVKVRPDDPLSQDEEPGMYLPGSDFAEAAGLTATSFDSHTEISETGTVALENEQRFTGFKEAVKILCGDMEWCSQSLPEFVKHINKWNDQLKLKEKETVHMLTEWEAEPECPVKLNKAKKGVDRRKKKEE
jgi:hypothetical protein